MSRESGIVRPDLAGGWPFGKGGWLFWKRVWPLKGVWLACAVAFCFFLLPGIGLTGAVEDSGVSDQTDEESVALQPPAWSFSRKGAPSWETLAPGLDLGRFPGRDSTGTALEMVILRIEPARYTFSVHAASHEGLSLSLGGWADRHGLCAAINASMYLPDGVSSTGYLRVGEHLNNPRVVSGFGAFFVCGPREGKGSLPVAQLLDRTTDDWESLLPRYESVVQNYRMISAERRLLWKEGGPRHAVAAVGRDSAGRIFFIHCREPVSGVDFASLLLDLPPEVADIRLVMYVEGGSQAGLLVRTPAFSQTWMGRHPADIWTSGNPSAPLPNVIGIRPRADQP